MAFTGLTVTGNVPTGDIIRVGNGVLPGYFSLVGYLGPRSPSPFVNDLRTNPELYGTGRIALPYPSASFSGTFGQYGQLIYYSLDPNTNQYINLTAVIPGDALAGRSCSFEVLWTGDTSGTNAVKWQISVAGAHQAGDQAAWPVSNYMLTDPFNGTVQKLQVSTIAGGVVNPGDHLSITVNRLATDAADTYADVAKVIGVRVLYTKEL